MCFSLPAAAARFLDRCDPEPATAADCCQQQQELLQAWLQHPLLDDLAAQPQAMLTLLHRLHQAAPAAAPAAAAGAAESLAAASLGDGGSLGTAAAVAAGGMSPGALLLALLLKMGGWLSRWALLQLAACRCMCSIRSAALCNRHLHQQRHTW